MNSNNEQTQGDESNNFSTKDHITITTKIHPSQLPILKKSEKMLHLRCLKISNQQTSSTCITLEDSDHANTIKCTGLTTHLP